MSVCAHLIVGRNEEPFLAPLLVSLEGAVDSLIVNDNAPDPSPHQAVLAESAFGRAGRLIVDRTPFRDFAAARNICLDLHARHAAGGWVAFVDADEVHGQAVQRIAGHLGEVPESVDFIDGYTWHFFASFDLYTSIERRMAFFRYVPGVAWSGPVHERLEGLRGRRVALPYVYAHYGHALPPRRHAEKGRLYSMLGQSGAVVPLEGLDAIDVAHYFRNEWPRLLRFAGEHPPAARETIAQLRARYAAEQARALELTAHAQANPATRARNLLRRLNYEQRWRARARDPLARALMR